jgi:hypothetical protein
LPREIYSYTPTDGNTLTWHLPCGLAVVLNRPMETDKGSIPPVLLPLCSDDRFLYAFLFHDSAYEWRELTIYADRPVTSPPPAWIPELALRAGAEPQAYAITRADADHMLRDGVGAQGGTLLHRSIIYAAVRAGGSAYWPD